MPKLPLIFQAPIKHLIITFYSCAILSTLFRLIYRTRAKQLWWDDFWAFLALINITILFGGYIKASLDPFQLKSLTTVLVTSRLALWSARLSIAVTIVRVIATGKSLLVSKIIATIFGLLGIVTIVVKSIICRPSGLESNCHGKVFITGYIDLATSFFADIWLLGAPAYLLRRMKLRKQFHRLLQAIFASEILVLITSIIHCVYTVKKNFQAEGISSYFKVATSLIVCNLLFLVTYVYRHLQNDQEQAAEPTAAHTRKIWTGNVYTTITHFTSILITSRFRSSRPESQQASSTGTINRPVLFESKPGIVIREWSSNGSALCGLTTV